MVSDGAHHRAGGAHWRAARLGNFSFVTATSEAIPAVHFTPLSKISAGIALCNESQLRPIGFDVPIDFL
ncbi:MAG: hypothetical protein GPOALKHO_000326 [Sodalis sp.]|nr:MAG: hypothetical protein GPOALKHO_000326 [Sodalis sp.]